MKKRIISLALVLCLLCLMFTACEQSSSFDVVDAALKKTQGLDSMAAEMKIDMEMAMEGMTMSIPMTLDLKANGLQSEKPTSSVRATTSMLGQEMVVEAYQEGDWAYFVMDDMKYKTAVADLEEGSDYSGMAKDMLQTLPEDLMEGIQTQKADDGSLTVEVPIPEDSFAQLYGDILDELNASAGLEEGVEAKITDAVVKITVANDYVTAYEMKYTVTVTTEGVTATTKAKAVMTINNIGEEVTVTPPEGYQDFEELGLDGILEGDSELTDEEIDLDDIDLSELLE